MKCLLRIAIAGREVPTLPTTEKHGTLPVARAIRVYRVHPKWGQNMIRRLDLFYLAPTSIPQVILLPKEKNPIIIGRFD